ncbi:hypothetical protein [Gordonia terrae]
MSSDPAVNAAEKVWAAGYAAYSNGRPFNPDDALADALITAAREALKPLRQLHYKTGPFESRYCSADLRDWPCATAKLVYSAEELR